jgi:hypothetical protein
VGLVASQGPNFAGTGASLANAGTNENAEAWVNPGNIVSDNGTEATITAATYDSPDISQLLVASNFGFTIPAGSTIDGIIVEIDRRNSVGAASDNRVQLATGTTFATLVGDNKADTALDWPTTTAVATYGTSTDNWNAGLDPTEVNATGFAVMLSVQADAANTDIQVDFIRVTIHYTPPAAQTISPSAVDTAEAVNTPSLILSVIGIAPTAVDTAETFGAHTLLAGNVFINPSSIPSDEAVGTPTLTGPAPAFILPSSVDTGEAVPAPSLILSNINISPPSIDGAENVPAPTLLPGNVFIIVGSVASDEFVGIPNLQGEVLGQSVNPSSISSEELFGLPSLIPVNNIVVESVAPAEVLGLPVLIPGAVTIIVGGISSLEAVGHPIIAIPGGDQWGKVSRSPAWKTTKKRGWSEARSSLTTTKRNEGNR